MGTMDACTPLPLLADEGLPLMPALLGPEARDLLSAATGLAVQQVTPRQVHWRPGHSLVVVAEAAGPGGSHGVFAMATGGELPAGAAVFEHNGDRAALWEVAADPALPGLALALDPAAAAAVAGQLGVDVDGASVRCALRSYRAGRRAVVEVTGPGLRLFIKVVRPSRVAGLQRRHRAAAGVLPVPRSHGWAEEHGLVVLESLPGQTLRDVLATEGGPLPDPCAVFGLLAALPHPAGSPADPTSVCTSARGHLPLLQRLLPRLAGRLDALVETIEDVRHEAPPVVLHGDLHDRQLLTAAGQVTGIVDIDTMGPGAAGDDHATLIGHLAAWEAWAPYPARVRAYARAVLALGDAMVPPGDLRRAVAATILGLATGPFRVLQPGWEAETERRIALAESWAASAVRVDEKALTPVSAGS